MIGIDANILVHAFDPSDAQKHAVCQRFVRQVLDGELRGAVTTQVLAEFAVVITRKVKQPIPRDTAAKIIRVIQTNPHWTVFPYVVSDIDGALGRDGSFWDGLIASTFLRNGVRTVMTYNAKDFRTTGMIVRAPA